MVFAGNRNGRFDVLSLTTVAMRQLNHAPGHHIGDLGAVIEANEMQAQIDTGGGTGRSEHSGRRRRESTADRLR